MRVWGAVAGLALIWVLPCDAVQSYTLTFDDHGEQAGQVIDDEYESLYGITISADGVSSGSPDVAAIYDSAPPTGGDSDLEFIAGDRGGGRDPGSSEVSVQAWMNGIHMDCGTG